MAAGEEEVNLGLSLFPEGKAVVASHVVEEDGLLLDARLGSAGALSAPSCGRVGLRLLHVFSRPQECCLYIYIYIYI